jgi:hypothetical protein
MLQSQPVPDECICCFLCANHSTRIRKLQFTVQQSRRRNTITTAEHNTVHILTAIYARMVYVSHLTTCGRVYKKQSLITQEQYINYLLIHSSLVKFFSDKKPCQLRIKAQRFVDHLCLHHHRKVWRLTADAAHTHCLSFLVKFLWPVVNCSWV